MSARRKKPLFPRVLWDDQRPTEPGWYWLEIRGHRYADPIQIWEADGLLWQSYDTATDLEGFDRQDGVLRWAGPLPEPTP